MRYIDREQKIILPPLLNTEKETAILRKIQSEATMDLYDRLHFAFTHQFKLQLIEPASKSKLLYNSIDDSHIFSFTAGQELSSRIRIRFIVHSNATMRFELLKHRNIPQTNVQWERMSADKFVGKSYEVLNRVASMPLTIGAARPVDDLFEYVHHLMALVADYE